MAWYGLHVVCVGARVYILRFVSTPWHNFPNITIHTYIYTYIDVYNHIV